MIAASHHCTNPQEIRAQNRKTVTAQWWNDPVYRGIEAELLQENPVCAYCPPGNPSPSQVAHHDNVGSYRSKDEYYKKENMTPACHECHRMLRRGFIRCPECGGWMMPGREKCTKCEGWRKRNARAGKVHHPCGHNIGAQRCQRNGQLLVCSRSPRSARGCDHFIDRPTRLSDEKILAILIKPHTMQALVAKIDIMSKRTVRYRVHALIEAGTVRETFNPRDMRSPAYVAVCREAEV